MGSKQIQHIIRSFREKHVRKDLQMRFRFWFRSKDGQKEKEEALQAIWEQTPSVVSERTWMNLSQLQNKIIQTEKRRPYLSLYGWRKYAAVILLVIISSVTTLFVNSVFKEERKVLFTECFVPYGETKQLTLPDGSAVWVNSGSVLVYPEHFSETSRSVYLTGEARFQVAKDPNHPFIVHTQALDVEALGTTFNVQAYPNKEKVVATLEEGSICVSSGSGSFEACILKPDEQLIYSRITRNAVVNGVKAVEFSSWKDGYLLFEDAGFEEIAVALERKYNVMIQYDQQKYQGRSYYVKFGPDETLEDALNILSYLVEGFKYKIVENVVFIN